MKPDPRYVIVTLLLDFLIIGMMAPVMPKLILQFMGGNVPTASAMLGLTTLVFASIQFFAAPVLGILSDRFGRRPIILLSNFGSVIDCTILALAPSIGWLFAGRMLLGATTASATSAAAYVADVTAPEKRAAAFGYVSGAFGAGFTLGPAIGGLLATFGTRVPFYAAALLMLVNAAYGFFVLPESLDPEHRRKTLDWSRANPLGSLRLIRRHRELTGLVSALFCSNLGVQSFSVFVLFTFFRFGWGDRANGFGLATFGLLTVVASIVVGRLVARFGPRTVVIGGFTAGALGFLLYGLAPNGLVFTLALLLTGTWAVAGPPIQSAMSKRVAPNEQGELQGAIGSMRSIAAIIGPPFYTMLFGYVSAHATYPLIGAPWFCGFAFLLAAAALAGSVLDARPQAETSVTPAVLPAIEADLA